MSVKIRLARTGKKYQISYRLVAQDTQSKRDGKFLEILGYYKVNGNDAANTKINQERVNYWLSKGAKPTIAVSKIINIKKGKTATTIKTT